MFEAEGPVSSPGDADRIFDFIELPSSKNTSLALASRCSRRVSPSTVRSGLLLSVHVFVPADDGVASADSWNTSGIPRWLIGLALLLRNTSIFLGEPRISHFSGDCDKCDELSRSIKIEGFRRAEGTGFCVVHEGKLDKVDPDCAGFTVLSELDSRIGKTVS